jgi:hypothetical protein
MHSHVLTTLRHIALNDLQQIIILKTTAQPLALKPDDLKRSLLTGASVDDKLASITRGVDVTCRFSLIRTIFLKKYNFARSRACLVGAKTMGFSRRRLRRQLMQGEIRDY